MAAHPALLSHLDDGSSRIKGEWGSVLEMAPSGARLLSPANVARQGLELVTNAAHGNRFHAVLTSVQSHLRDASVSVLVKQGDPPIAATVETLSRSQRRWLGQLALELYFTQLYRSEVAILDLWPSRFGVDDAGDAVWSPRPLYLRWDPRFREGLRDVYAGFFLDDRVRFERGVSGLGLGGAADVLVKHFGDGNQRSVRFGTETLRKTLQSMSTQRRSSDRPLHRNFIAFGLYLTALHELLESLDMRFDVRAAFMRSYPARSQR